MLRTLFLILMTALVVALVGYFLLGAGDLFSFDLGSISGSKTPLAPIIGVGLIAVYWLFVVYIPGQIKKRREKKSAN